MTPPDVVPSPLGAVDRSRARRWAGDLGAELARTDRQLEDPSLANGSAGLAVLFGALHGRTSDPDWQNAADDALARAVDGLTDQLAIRGVGFYSGLSGVAWAELLVDGLLGRDPSANPAVAELVQSVVDEDPGCPWELTKGLVGLGVYAQHCVDLGDPPALLTSICQRLLDEHRDGTWLVDGDKLFGSGQSVRPAHYEDFGMAHGIAGIVAFAALARPTGGSTVVDELLARSVAALVSGDHAAVLAGPHALPPRWCYGDVGIAAALSMARHRRPADATLATAAAKKVTRALGALCDEVVDLGLCHGVAGVALVLGRLAALTDGAGCAAACRSWSETLLGRLDAHGRAADVIEAAGPGVLEGAAGIALALSSLADPKPSGWERMLLLI